MVSYMIEMAVIEAVQNNVPFTVIGFEEGHIVMRNANGYWMYI